MTEKNTKMIADDRSQNIRIFLKKACQDNKKNIFNYLKVHNAIHIQKQPIQKLIKMYIAHMAV